MKGHFVLCSIIAASLFIFQPAAADDVKRLIELSDSLSNMHSYDSAIAVGYQALALAEKSAIVDDTLIANILNRLGYYFSYGIGDFKKAESLWQRSYEILSRTLEPTNIGVIRILNRLAIANWQMGKYQKAEEYYNICAARTVKSLGMRNEMTATILFNLATLYHSQSKYRAAEPLYLQALEIRKEVLGPGHLDVARCLNNLATLYLKRHQYADCEAAYFQALAIKQDTLGFMHPEVASTILNLATLYQEQGDLDRPDSLLKLALDIYRTTFGPSHPNTCLTMVNLASIATFRKDYDFAESLFVAATARITDNYGPEHPDVSHCLAAQGTLYSEMGQFDKAESYFMEALAIRETVLGRDAPDVAGSLEAITRLYGLQERWRNAMDAAERAFAIRRDNFTNYADILSEGDALQYSYFTTRAADLYLTCLFNLGNVKAADINNAVNLVLSSKGKVSDEIFERQRDIIDESDSVVAGLAESLRFEKFKLSGCFVNGPGDNITDFQKSVDSLKKRIDEVEEELLIKSADFRERKSYKNINVERIREHLPDNFLLVEYLKYNRIQPGAPDSIPYYLAAIVRKDEPAQIVDLGEAAAVDSLVTLYCRHMLRIATTEVMISESDQTEYEPIGHGLYNKIWRPVEEYMQPGQLILIAPDGALNLISFAGLCDEDGIYVIEKHAVHYLSAGRDLLRIGDYAVTGRGLLAIGDPDFDALISQETTEHGREERTSVDHLLPVPLRGDISGRAYLDNLHLDRLPGSRTEIEDIAKKWNRSGKNTAVVYLGAEATEENFKANAPGKQVIHLATHGYFLGSTISNTGDVEADTDRLEDAPLLLSGLFFAGANAIDKEADRGDVEDGILTALEVSSMNLEGTVVTVLSACETGLGEVAAGEGVYGLQRAFLMAGVRTVVSTLWPISDRLGSAVLDPLYEGENISFPEMIRQAQLEIINERRKQHKADHPFVWSAFIVTGDWRYSP